MILTPGHGGDNDVVTVTVTEGCIILGTVRVMVTVKVTARMTTTLKVTSTVTVTVTATEIMTLVCLDG